ncbi:MAG: hypothetical protein R3E68_23305 [Burkholderiaceae bacterium]
MTFKSAKTGSSYYQMAVQIAEGVKTASQRQDHRHRRGKPGVRCRTWPRRRPGSGNYVFTTPPALVGMSQQGKGPFKDKTHPKFEQIRAVSDSVADHALRHAW